MKKKLTESSLKGIIKQYVAQALNEGFYKGEYDRTGMPLDDNAYVNSYEYIIDTIINGNWSQAEKQVSRLKFKERMELLNYAREIGQEDKVMDLFGMLKESKKLNEAEDGGWVVDDSEADEAYSMFVNAIGEERANQEIVGCLGKDELAECLAFLFRMYDFREWEDRNSDVEDED